MRKFMSIEYILQLHHHHLPCMYVSNSMNCKKLFWDKWKSLENLLVLRERVEGALEVRMEGESSILCKYKALKYQKLNQQYQKSEQLKSTHFKLFSPTASRKCKKSAQNVNKKQIFSATRLV